MANLDSIRLAQSFFDAFVSDKHCRILGARFVKKGTPE
jgi:hypothetical protein